MTNKQLSKYEALKNEVEKCSDNLTDTVLQLGGMSPREQESAEDYLLRLQAKLEEVKIDKLYLKQAKDKLRDFVIAL